MAEAMTTRTRLSVLLISTPLLAFIVLGGMMGKASGGDQTFQHLRVFEDVVSLILNNYVEEAKVDKVMEGAMRGLADGLDPDSAYLTAAEVKSMEPGGEKFPGGDVGIELTRQYYLRIIAARDDSPAAKAGLQTGDYVRAIDGKAARDLSVFEGMRLLRGAPGTKVTLTVIRGNAAEPRQIELVREKTPGTVVTGKMLPDGLGYIRISAFSAETAARLKTQAAELQKSGARHLIVDVRRTAEGPFETGIEAARAFVKAGTLAMVAGRDPQAPQPPSATAPPAPAGRPADVPVKVSKAAIKETIAARPGDGGIALPVTLLVTTGTSGAAELFAAALDGNDRAQLVGERTLGRAAIQKLVRLPDGRGLWLTHARYLTPTGDVIQSRGLTPDLAVDEPDVDFDQVKPTTDPVLDAAVEKIKRIG
jgi:carboxyl-terminal processing protease